MSDTPNTTSAVLEAATNATLRFEDGRAVVRIGGLNLGNFEDVVGAKAAAAHRSQIDFARLTGTRRRLRRLRRRVFLPAG